LGCYAAVSSVRRKLRKLYPPMAVVTDQVGISIGALGARSYIRWEDLVECALPPSRRPGVVLKDRSGALVPVVMGRVGLGGLAESRMDGLVNVIVQRANLTETVKGSRTYVRQIEFPDNLPVNRPASNNCIEAPG
jgi:hypothetical protein